jgi:hypothetical protein
VRREAEKALQAVGAIVLGDRGSSHEVAIYVNVGPMASNTDGARDDARLKSLRPHR